MIGVAPVLDTGDVAGSDLHLYLLLLDPVHPVQVAVEAVLAGVLLAALRADHVGVLVPEVHVLDVALEGHLVEVLVAVGALLPAVPLLLAGGVRGAVAGDLGVGDVLHGGEVLGLVHPALLLVVVTGGGGGGGVALLGVVPWHGDRHDPAVALLLRLDGHQGGGLRGDGARVACRQAQLVSYGRKLEQCIFEMPAACGLWRAVL